MSVNTQQYLGTEIYSSHDKEFKLFYCYTDVNVQRAKDYVW